MKPNASANQPPPPLPLRLMLYLARIARWLLLAAIYALVVWYGLVTTAQVDAPPILLRTAIAAIALGITGSIYQILPGIVGEVKDIIMALASLLNTHLVEPQKRRLIARGHAEGRTAVLDELRPILHERGINLDDLIQHEKEETDTHNRC